MKLTRRYGNFPLSRHPTKGLFIVLLTQLSWEKRKQRPGNCRSFEEHYTLVWKNLFLSSFYSDFFKIRFCQKRSYSEKSRRGKCQIWVNFTQFSINSKWNSLKSCSCHFYPFSEGSFLTKSRWFWISVNDFMNFFNQLWVSLFRVFRVVQKFLMLEKFNQNWVKRKREFGIVHVCLKIFRNWLFQLSVIEAHQQWLRLRQNQVCLRRY